MRTLKTLLVALTVLSVCSLASAAEFWDDFESYVPGSQMHGQGGWEGWTGVASASAPASDAYAYSGSVSVEIISTADLVQPFTVSGGKWILSAMMYAPSGTTGDTMWIVLNDYAVDWSIQTTFNLNTGAITSAYDTETGAIIYDQWVEIKNVIDLDNNTVDEYYNGELLFTHDWDDDPADPPGIGCLDLYGNSASSVYYDDILLIDVASIPSEPSPANGATDVALDTDLSWTAGTDTSAYNVYLGTDPAALALVGEDLSTATVDLDALLVYGTVYYWRVDPVRADGSVDKGDTWSFTTEPYLYEIQNVIATTNAVSADPVENLVNGSGLNEAGEHSTDTSDMWTATPSGADPMYVQFEFDDIYPITAMNVWNHNFIFEMALGIGIKDVTVETSTDGVEWTLFGDAVLAQATGLATYTANTTLEMQNTPAKYVRLTINSKYGPSPQYGLSEVRFVYSPKTARYPVPADGAVDVAVDTELAWRVGREAAEHEIYLGTDADALTLIATTTENSYSPTLELNTTYAWRVDEVNDAEAPSVWTGAVWTFTTEEALLLDDFESYNDDIDAGTTIWQTWIDSLDNPNAGGSVVGYDQSPFTEQTTVYTGGNSMPLRYDNSSAGFSETTRTFSPAQKWNQYGITTLTLWVKGGADLSANEKLYVKVNGTKVVYDGALTAPIWQPFNVDLTSMNVSNVSTLTIGVQGSGQGIIFVDTIALRATPVTLIDKTMMGYWKFDETSGMIAADSSGYGHDGTLVGMAETQWTTGINGGALEFAGISTNPQWVDMGTAPNLEFAGSVTMSAWVKMNEGNSGVYMGIGGRLNTSPYVGFALVRHSSNVFRLWANSASGELAGFEASSDATYTDTEWHHVVGVVDDGTSMLYVDGVKQAQEGDVDLQVSPGIFCLGKQYNVGENHRYWLGLMDDVKVFYRALSADEVAGL